MINLNKILTKAIELEASDIHLVLGKKTYIKNKKSFN